jgi:hypothetical protein
VAVIGGVVIGIIFLALFGIFCCMFLGRRSRWRHQNEEKQYIWDKKKANEALDREFAPHVTVPAMAYPGTHRDAGDSDVPARSTNRNTSWSNAVLHPVVLTVGRQTSWTQQHHPNVHGPSNQQSASAKRGELIQPPCIHLNDVDNRGQVEVDMPPPNYDHVFTPGTSTYGGSAGSIVSEASLPNPHDPRILRELQEKGIPVSSRTGVTRIKD